MSRMRTILAEVAAERRIKESELLGRERYRPVALARQEAMARMYATGALSSTQIARFFDRDHTTVLHAIRKVAQRAAE